MNNKELVALRVKLKTGEYDGQDIMAAWLAIDDLMILRKAIAEGDLVVSKPSTSLDFILEWMDRAAKVAMQQNHPESAQLWIDAISHLKHLNNEIDRLQKQIDGEVPE